MTCWQRFARLYNRIWDWWHQPLWGKRVDYREPWEDR